MENVNARLKYWVAEMSKAEAKKDYPRINVCTERIQHYEYLQGY